MGLLKALFGPATPPAKPYVDEGLALTKRLIGLLNLPDWASGTPTFTKREIEAIDRELNSFQRMADGEARKDGHSQMLFHPEVIGTMQRTFGGEALRRLAGPGLDIGWDIDGDCPEDWRTRVSTYLKAWAMKLDPDALLEMAQLLALAGYKSEGREAARIVADRFAAYSPRFFVGVNDPGLVESITERARDVVSEISKPRLLLLGLNGEESILAIWKLLFSPTLQKHFGSGNSLDWTKKLIAHFADGNEKAYSSQYNSLIPEVKAAMSRFPSFSISNPPWSMVSLDMRVGMIPWVTPMFDRGFGIFLENCCALEKHFGDVLPFAFFLRGGPGESRATAFRVCAPTNAVRVGAEYWLMRAYLDRQDDGPHATLAPDEADRTFSVHNYLDKDGIHKKIFFETTDSFGREEEDFAEFLQGYM